MRRPLVCAIVLAALLASAGGARGQAPAAESSPRQVALKTPCCDFALAADIGAMVGIDPAANTATLYPEAYLDGTSQRIVGPVKVGGRPTSVVYKRHKDKAYFVICYLKDSYVHVLDAKTLAIVRKIPIRSPEAYSMGTATDPADPYVYYVRQGQPGRVNLATFQDEGDLEDVETSEMAISADGRTLYGRRTGVSPTGFDAWQQQTDPNTGLTRWVQIHDEHRSTAAYVPGAFSFYTAAGTALYTADLGRKVADLSVYPVCFFPDRPLIVCRSGSRGLVGVSYNTLKTFGRANLPDGFTKQEDFLRVRDERSRWFHKVQYRMRFLPDSTGDRLVVAYGPRAAVVPVKALGVPDEPLLLADARAPKTVFVGQRVMIPCPPRDKRCTVALKEGPEGMKLSAGTLTWMPQASQVGRVKVVLKLTHAKVERLQSLEMNVAQRAVTVGFVPDAITTNPAGTLALAWRGGGRRDMWPSDRGAEMPRAELALIDLAKIKVLAKKKLLYQVATAAVDDHFVYVAPAASDRVNALSHKDLTRQKYSLTDSRVDGLVAVASKWLVAASQRGVTTYSVPALKPMATVLSRKPPAEADRYRERERQMMRMEMRYGRGRREAPGVLTRLGGCWYGAGCVFGPALEKIRMLVDARGLPEVKVDRQQPASPPTRWNRYLADGMLKAIPARSVARLARGTSLIMPDHPVAVTLTTSRGDEGGLSARLTLRDLISGEPLKRVALLEQVEVDRSSRRYRPYDMDGRGGALASAGSRIIAAVNKQVFVYVLDPRDLRKFPRPFEIDPFASIPVLKADGPMVLKHSVQGGIKPFEFELSASHKAVRIDSATGDVTIDGPALVQAAVATMLPELPDDVEEAVLEGKAMPQPEKVAAMLTAAGKRRLAALLGRETKGFGMLLPVGVLASDSVQQVAMLDYQVVVEVPDEQVRQAVGRMFQELAEERKKREERRAESDRRRKDYERRRAEERARLEGIRAGRGDPNARLDELEKRVNALEAKIDLLLKVLQEGRSKEPGK